MKFCLLMRDSFYFQWSLMDCHIGTCTKAMHGPTQCSAMPSFHSTALVWRRIFNIRLTPATHVALQQTFCVAVTNVVSHGPCTSPRLQLLTRLGSKQGLVIIDAFSKYIEIFQKYVKTARHTVKALKKWVEPFGIPTHFSLTEDPDSSKFTSYCAASAIKTSLLSAEHPQGNGLAKSAVKLAKWLIALCKTEEDLLEPNFAWHLTPP